MGRKNQDGPKFRVKLTFGCIVTRSMKFSKPRIVFPGTNLSWCGEISTAGMLLRYLRATVNFSVGTTLPSSKAGISITGKT